MRKGTKLLHLSDLHLGKRVNEFSMLEDQAHILKEVIHIIEEEQPDAILIAGDIYDKSIPPIEAVELFDDFLVQLADRKQKVLIISGNHDSPERIAFGARLMDRRGIYISPVYQGNVEPVFFSDEFGTVNIFLLPFLKPVMIRRLFPEEAIESYSDAVRVTIEHMNLDAHQRNVLVTHQFVTGALCSESEEISVGGADNVDLSVFAPFDYVALGHLHASQQVGKETIRYSGTPLKYSFSEANHTKSVTIVELFEKGQVDVRTIPLTPKRDLREIKGTYMEVTAKEFYEGTNCEDYLHVTLTDEEEVVDAIGKLRSIYPNIMKLDYDNERTRSNRSLAGSSVHVEQSPLELFAEFYELQNNQEMAPEQRRVMERWIEKIWEEEL